jgi:PGF-CTERM protein
MKRLATTLTVLVLTASIGPSTVAASIAPITAGQASVTSQHASGQQAIGQQASGQAYAGTHVSLNASERAVADYAVHGETMLDSVAVESQSSVEDGGLVDVGASVSAVTQIEGAGVALDATTETEARIEADNGATVTAHDNGHGILVVESGDQSDYVVANLSAGASASAESDSQVEVTTENGTEGTFIVVGEGNATVNDDGDVTAHLGEDGRLVFRAYPEGKDDNDDEQERLIADGDAKAEAYVMAASERADGNETGNESEGDAGNETETGDENDSENGTEGDGEQMVVDTVSYDDNTTVETAESAEGEVAFTVNRTTHEGTILVTSVSEEALNASEDLTVQVDGEAAVEAATYSQLRSAIGSEQSRYTVESAGSGSASADVLVAVNNFSERTVSMQSETGDESGAETTDGESGTSAGETTDDETTDSDPADGTTDATDAEDNDGGIPGFGVTAAVVALIGAALLARLR